MLGDSAANKAKQAKLTAVSEDAIENPGNLKNLDPASLFAERGHSFCHSRAMCIFPLFLGHSVLHRH